MILADKIIELRKKNGLSQEELGEKLGVSRQAVSKWESIQAIPDITKIIKMADLFGVTTDYLLKDEMDTILKEDADKSIVDNDVTIHRINLEEANDYFNMVKKISTKFALGFLFFCISPIIAILLVTIGENYNVPFSDEQGGIFGVISETFILLVVLELYVTSFIQKSKFAYLKKGKNETEYGVDSLAKEYLKEYKQTYFLNIIIGTVLCFFSVIPVMTCSMLYGKNNLIIAIGGCIMLFLIGIGAYLIIKSCIKWRGYKKILNLH